MIRGMCEDYRAAATIDLEHDRASRAAGQRVQCPMLVLWGSKGKIGKWYDPLDIWRQYCAAEVAGQSVNSGHYLAEETPGEVLAAFKTFFGRQAGHARDP
jgi:haloacetate dehalogenase